MKQLSLLLLVQLLLWLSQCKPDTEGSLYKCFLDPPAEARPFVNWWWNGNRVTEGEIKRQLNVLRSAGIGGVEINPIYMAEP